MEGAIQNQLVALAGVLAASAASSGFMCAHSYECLRFACYEDNASFWLLSIHEVFQQPFFQSSHGI